MPKPNSRVFLLFILLCFTLVTELHAQRTQIIKAVEGLQFNPVRLHVKAGQDMVIKFQNDDPSDMPHNFVLIKPSNLQKIQKLSLQPGAEAAKNHYVPKHESILISSKVIEADKHEILKFKAPEKPGIYHYVCTYPGHAFTMYGALYVGDRHTLPLGDDPNVPKIARDNYKVQEKAKIISQRPATLRLFMPNSGPASIAVALPEDFNYCWDAGNCRLRYAWSGQFVKPYKMYNSNGNHLVEVMGDIFWSSTPGERVYGIQSSNPNAKPDFKGYQMIADIPEFHYLFDGLSVRERLTSNKDGILWNFKISNAKDAVRILAPGKVSGDLGKREGDHWTIDAESAKNFTLSLKP